MSDSLPSFKFGLSFLSVLLIVSARTATAGPDCSSVDYETNNDGYKEVETLEQLQCIKEELSEDYILINDINASDTESWNGGDGFEPIGDGGLDTGIFSGRFDGSGFTISHLYIDREDQDFIGLFGRVQGPVINVGLYKSRIKGQRQVGALIGFLDGYGRVEESFSTGWVSGSQRVGGLIGTNEGGEVSNTYSLSEVEGGMGTGGLVGNNANGESRVRNSYAAGKVEGSSIDVGGLIGRNYIQSSAGGDTLHESYWDRGTTNQDEAVGNGGSEYEVEGYGNTGNSSPDDLMTGNIAEQAMGFLDFQNIWQVEESAEGESYPYLTNTPQDPKPGMQNRYAGGTGSENAPYEIENWYHLDEVREDLDAHFKLVNDLDENTEGYEGEEGVVRDENGDLRDGDGFIRLGDSNDDFTGTFDGNDHEIQGLILDRGDESTDRHGMFRVNDGVIKNLILSDVDFAARHAVGGLAGENTGTIENVSVSGKVQGDDHTGGLVGRFIDGDVTNASANVEVESSGDNAGGLVGMMEEETFVTESYALGNVESESDYAGGLVGYMSSDSEITMSFALGDVNADNSVGGLVGNVRGTINYSYAHGDVDIVSGSYIGGLVGDGSDAEEIRNVYALGEVTGGVAEEGGLVGAGDVDEGGYWDVENSSMTSGSGDGTVDGDGLDTHEMLGASAEDVMEQLNFDDTWETVVEPEGVGRPVLKELDRQVQVNNQQLVPPELSITGDFSTESKTYDSETDAVIDANNIEIDPAGLEEGYEDVAVSDFEVEFENAEVGDDKIVELIAAELNGDDAGFYELAEDALEQVVYDEGEIIPAELTVDGAEALDKAYDASTDAEIVDAELQGGVGDDDVNLDHADTGTFEDEGPANDLEVTPDFEVSGDDADNYQLTLPSLNADIRPRAVVESIDKLDDTPTNADEIEFEIEFNEPVTLDSDELEVLTTGDITDVEIIDATPGTSEQSTTHTATVETGENSGTVAIRVPEQAGEDQFGEPLDDAPFESNAYTINRTVPEVEDVVVASGIDDPTNEEAIDITVEFTEEVTGFDYRDLEVDNGSVSDGDTGSGEAFDVTVNAESVDQASQLISISVPEAMVADEAGNENEAADDVFTIEFGDTRPTAEFTTVDDPVGQSPVRVTLAVDEIFGEQIEGFDIDVITTENVEQIELAEDNNPEFELDVTPDGQGPMDISISLDENAITDAAGNQNPESDALTFEFDSTPPTVEITSNQDDPTNADVIAFEVEFDKDVEPIERSDLSLDGSADANFGDFTVIDDRTFGFTAEYEGTDGTVSVNVPQGITEDAAGNENEESTEPYQISFEHTQPDPVITTSPDSPTNVQPIPVEIDFGKPVADFTENKAAEGVDTESGSYEIENFDTGDDQVYTFDLLLEDDTETLTLQLDEGVVSDPVGNESRQSNELEVHFNNIPPEPDFKAVADGNDYSDPELGDPTNADAFTLFLNFGEELEDLDSGELDISGAGEQDGSLSTVEASEGLYSLRVIVTDDGQIEAEVPAGAAEDLAGNTNEAASFSIEADRNAPVPSISTVVAEHNNETPIPIEIDFGKPVPDFDADIAENAINAENDSDFSLENFEKDSEEQSFTFELTPDQDDIFTAELSEAMVNDQAGNPNESSNAVMVNHNTDQPDITFTAVEGGGDIDDEELSNPTDAGFFKLYLDFGEQVENFEENDLIVTNGDIDFFNVNDEEDGIYSLMIVPDQEDLVIVEVEESATTDRAGNDNEAGVFEIESNRSAPEVEDITKVDGLENPTNKSEFVVEITFSEEIADFHTDALDIENASATEYSSEDDIVFEVSIEADEVDQNASSIEIGVPEGAFTDHAGNENEADQQDFSITFGDTRPAAEFSTSANTPTGESPIRVTLKIEEIFGDNVEGFDVDDITTENVDHIELVEDNNPDFELDVTPDGDGPIEMSLILEEGAVTDAAGNENVASEELTIEYDAHPPVVEINSDEDNPTNADPIPVDITFSKPVWGFESSDVEIRGEATHSLVSGGDGEQEFMIHLEPDETTDTEELTLLIAEGVAQDEAGNQNEEADAFQVTYDAVSPEVESLSARNPNSGDEIEDYTQTSEFELIVIFDKAISNFDKADLSFENITPLSYETEDNREFEVTVEVENSNDVSPSIEVDVPEGVFVDAAGNPNQASMDPFRVHYYATPQQVSLVSPEDEEGNISLLPELEWLQVDHATDYYIEVATDSRFDEIEQTHRSSATELKIPEKLDYATTYYWRARAENEEVYGEWSDAQTFTTAPETPSEVTLTAPKDGQNEVTMQPELEWQPAEQAESYEIQMDADEGFDESIIDTTLDASDEPYFQLPESLSSSVTYHWRIRGVNSGGAGEWSDVYSFTTKPEPPPVVELDSPIDFTGSVELNPELQWQPADRAQTYHLEVAADSVFKDIVQSNSISSSTLEMSEELDYGTSYHWRIKAENAGGKGDWSDAGTFITIAESPELLFPVADAEGISTAPQLNWSSSHENAEYEVRFGTDSDFEQVSQTFTTDESSYQLKGLSEGTTYYWKARVNNQATTSEWSSIQYFTTRRDPEEVTSLSAEISFDTILEDEMVPEDYQLIGLPGAEAFELSEVFEGEYHTDWRAFGDLGDESEELIEYGGEEFEFRLGQGRGLWVIHRDDIILDMEVPQVEVDEGDTYSMDLNEGWNIISSPFEVPVSWRNVEEYNNWSATLYGYDLRFTEAADLQPLEGYYVYNDPEEAVDSLLIPYSAIEKRMYNGEADLDEGQSQEKVADVEEEPKHIELSAKFEDEDEEDQQDVTTSVFWNYNSEYISEPHPSLDMARFGVVLHGEEAIHRQLNSTYSDQVNEYELTVKAPVGYNTNWETDFENMDEGTAILLVNPVTRQSEILQQGESADIEVTEPEITYEAHIGEHSYLEEVQEALVPDEITLKQNYPNPFNPTTNIRYALVEDGQVTLEVYNILGQRVTTLVDEAMDAGWHNVEFDGSSLASGTYLYRLITDNEIKTGKMMLVK